MRSWARSSLLANAALPKGFGERGSPRLQEMFSGFFPPLSPANAEPLPHRKPFCWAGKFSAAVETESAFTCKIPRNREGWHWGRLPQQFAAGRYHPQRPVVRKEKILRMQAEHRPGCAGCPFPEAKLETHEVKTSGGFWRGTQAESDVPWCAGTGDAIPGQSHLCLTAEQVPSPHLTLSLIAAKGQPRLALYGYTDTGWHI